MAFFLAAAGCAGGELTTTGATGIPCETFDRCCYGLREVLGYLLFGLGSPLLNRSLQLADCISGLAGLLQFILKNDGTISELQLQQAGQTFCLKAKAVD